MERFLRSQGFSRHLVITTKYQEHGLLLDGSPTRSNVRLHAGQLLTAAIVSHAPNENLQPAELPLSIVYEDEDIIVLPVCRYIRHRDIIRTRCPMDWRIITSSWRNRLLHVP